MASIFNVFRNPYSTSALYAIALLLFFLPFVEIKCKQSKKFEKTPQLFYKELPPATITGFGMMTGTIQRKSQKNTEGSVPVEDVREQYLKPVLLVNFAFFVGLIGFVFSLISFNARSVTIVITATLPAICLIVERFLFKSSLDPGLHLEHARIDDLIQVRFTAWYYLSAVCFLIAAFLGYRQGLLALPANEELFEFSHTD